MGVGDVRIILSGDSHAIRIASDSPAETLGFMRSDDHNIDEPPEFDIGNGPVNARLISARLRPDWPGDLRRMAVPPVIGIDANTNATYAAIRVQNIETSSKGSGATTLLTRIAQIMLTIGLRDHPSCPALFQMSTSLDPIGHAAKLISREPAAQWTVAELANKVGMGRSSFAARFTAEVGRTPMEVVTEHRMRLAADLLKSSPLKITEISERSGYGSEAAFSRRFRRYYGLTPGQMRQQAQS